MTPHSEEPEIAAEPPVAKSNISLVVVLSTSLGILLTVLAAGAYLHFQKSSAMESELAAANDVLKEKNLLLDEMKAQIEVLSKQVHVLKEHSVARSHTVRENDKNAESADPAAGSVEDASKSPGEKGKTVSPETPDAQSAKKKKPEAENCELVGKSPEEQAATLRRCVGMMDAPKGALR
ncbi:hypothetical protein PROAA_570012 [Candidatus Propionivibrio aalborgensis]|uniref:Uncharacterized protein n=1 Tax=Candidatus Propionivibrio aalborgensis TaxID=1860101 RepID=A0A1A8Y089_9RHOO|nr:hypothetical protein [Candidatus Propionivibrio aalborgensis]MBK7325036.1 hypothetical protein [Propionivibrio sp.]MBK7563519.1 hypothetical protein [Propionivibrio sp.]SBT10594.1 hypothetical protein PROAA_570012 [Candidatus Propionivibrio aalborgensis]HRC61012.1 hypothetical protein [Candidatus Propionivibrio aalborgensis]